MEKPKGMNEKIFNEFVECIKGDYEEYLDYIKLAREDIPQFFDGDEEGYEDVDELEFIYRVLQANPLGVNIHHLTMMLGLHWNDYSKVWELVKACCKKHKCQFKVFKPGGQSMIMLRNTNFYNYFDIISNAYLYARKASIKFPSSQTKAGRPQLSPEEKAVRKEKRKAKREKKKALNRDNYVREQLHKLNEEIPSMFPKDEMFTVYDFEDEPGHRLSGLKPNTVKKFLDKYVALGVLRKIAPERRGAGNKVFYELTGVRFSEDDIK